MEFVAPGSRGEHWAALESVFGSGVVAEFDAELPFSDGSSAWYRSRMFPYREGEEVIYAVIVGTNVTELKAAQEAAARLRRLLPICSWCDRIQNSEGTWESIERYLADRLETQVTHGMCPRCYAREMGAEESEQGGSVA